MGALLLSSRVPAALVPEKAPPLIPDRQDFQTPDHIQLHGWLGARIEANEGNRLAKLDTDRLLEGYRKRPGRQIWDGEHVGKWLHAATLAWVNTGDPALRKKLDYVAAELPKCQLADGYLGTYEEKERWTLWDVWAHKYNLIGLITYMRYTGNLEPLPCCRRMAELLCKTFGDEPGQRDIILAGQHMGMAPTSVLEPMVLLYRLTGEPRYLDFCKYILRAWEHPNGPKIISTLLKEKRVDKVGNGKAYEMLSCINGALEYYRSSGDKQILAACLNAWQDIVDHRLYLTGAASYREFFHDDFDLPNVNNVGETCVTVTWLQFNAHLLRLTGEARFAEQLEKVTLNQLFGAQCPDGSAWGYYVQMQGKKPYSSTLDGHCCLSSGPRGIALVPTFVASTDADGVVINLYESSTAKLMLRDGTGVTLVSDTKYPSDELIHLTATPASKHKFTIKLRIPAWCADATIQVNGKATAATRGSDGYAAVHREWAPGDKLDLHLPLAPRVVQGDHKNDARLAIMYGPLVLAADSALLTTNQPLTAIGVPGPELAQLHFTRSAPVPGGATSESKSTSENPQLRPTQIFHISGSGPGVPPVSPGVSPANISLVPFADAGASGSNYRIWLPYKQPPPTRNLLMDGVEIRSRKPNAGSIIDDNPETIAATFNNKRAPDDWFGVELEVPVTISRVVFVHGKTYHDGGWFDTTGGKPYIQIKSSPTGEWEKIGEVKTYPTATATDAAGLKAGEPFTLDLPNPAKVFALRVVGKPSSGDNPKQSFSTCAELQAFNNL